MDWDKKVYPKDIWNWIKKPLGFIAIILSSNKSYHDELIKKIRKRKKTYDRTKGGFTPRRSVSEVDSGYFDTDGFFEQLEADKKAGIDPMNVAHERMRETFRRIDKRMERMLTPPITDSDIWDNRK